MSNKVDGHVGRLALSLAMAGAAALSWTIAPAANANGDAIRDAGRNISSISAHQSFIRIGETGELPLRKNIKIGLGKSVLFEFPRDVRDVMVSNPAAIDAVVLSANRVFLLARKIGEANAFFFDGSRRTVRHDGSLRRARNRRPREHAEPADRRRRDQG